MILRLVLQLFFLTLFAFNLKCQTVSSWKLLQNFAYDLYKYEDLPLLKFTDITYSDDSLLLFNGQQLSKSKLNGLIKDFNAGSLNRKSEIISGKFTLYINDIVVKGKSNTKYKFYFLSINSDSVYEQHENFLIVYSPSYGIVIKSYVRTARYYYLLTSHAKIPSQELNYIIHRIIKYLKID